MPFGTRISKSSIQRAIYPVPYKLRVDVLKRRQFREGPLEKCYAEPSYTYRQGVEADAGSIRQIILSQAMNPIGLNPSNFIVASSESDSVIGFGQVVQHGQDSSELRSLFVKPEHRKKSVGRTLVSKLVDRRGGTKLYLLCPKYNCAFYEACGFVALAPWQLPRFLQVDAALGAVILAVVQRSTIVGMVYSPEEAEAVVPQLQEDARS